MNQALELLKTIDRNDGDNWTDEGLPRLDIVRNLFKNQALTRKELSEMAPGFNRFSFEKTISENPIERLEKIKVELEIVRKEKDKINRKYDDLVKEHDKLIIYTENLFGARTTQNAISEYLESQKKILNERAENIKAIKESGIHTVLNSMRLKSPIDQALKGRKRVAKAI